MLAFLATAIGTIVILGLAVNGIVKPSTNDRVKELEGLLQEQYTENQLVQQQLQVCVAATEECFSFLGAEWCSKTGRPTK